MVETRLTRDEIERLKSILGTMVSRGVNPNVRNDFRVVTNREDLETIIRIFDKLCSYDEKKDE